MFGHWPARCEPPVMHRVKLMATVMRPEDIRRLHENTNPYEPPSTHNVARIDRASTRCPVCDLPLSRFRLVFSTLKCANCGNQIRLYSSFMASSISAISAITCFFPAPISRLRQTKIPQCLLCMLWCSWFSELFRFMSSASLHLFLGWELRPPLRWRVSGSSTNTAIIT